MSRSISLAALAIAAVCAGSVVACADTDQPDRYEAFGGSGSSTSTSDLTSSTAASDAQPDAAAPKTGTEADEEDAKDKTDKDTLHSNDHASKNPLKGT